MTDPFGRQRGFALLIVLWVLAVLSLLGTQLVATARERTQVARNLRDAALLDVAVDGAVQHAVFEMLRESGPLWDLNGAVHIIRIGTAAISVRLEDEGGKVNPNIASADLLAAVLGQVGLDARRAESLAAAIVDWREPDDGQPRPLGAKTPQYVAANRDYGPQGAPFMRLDELGLVLGMTPEILARLRPHLTIFTDADPDLTSHDPVVVAALQQAAAGGGVEASGVSSRRGISIAQVIVVARGPNNTSLGRRAIVRTNARGTRHRYEILASEYADPEP